MESYYLIDHKQKYMDFFKVIKLIVSPPHKTEETASFVFFSQLNI